MALRAVACRIGGGDGVNVTTRRSATMRPPLRLCARWGLHEPRLLAHRANTHWRVDSRRGGAVLRRYGVDIAEHDLAYELGIGDQLAAAGWPVPPLIEPPIRWHGRWWALFGLLPGEQRDGSAEDRRRGRLLAEVHATTSTFPAARRAGQPPVRELVFDPQLGDALRFIERHFPRQGRVLLWHREAAARRFAEATGPAPTTVIHGDFNSRNLLFVGERLSGLLDFEATHHDYRVADFALAWRARRDEVVLGYDAATKLTEADWQLLTPCLWAWAFRGVAAEVTRMRRGDVAPHGFDWQVEMLLRRSPLMGPDAGEYRHGE